MKERMELLCNTGVITPLAFDVTMNASRTLQIEWGIDLNTDQVQMVMTHFSRAIVRIEKDEAVSEGLNPDILEEITSSEVYSEIIRVNLLMCGHCLDLQIPATENSFFISNLYSIYLNR